jgi:hypothetical protein
VIASNGTLAQKIEIEDDDNEDDDDYDNNDDSDSDDDDDDEDEDDDDNIHMFHCIVDKYLFICKKKHLVGYELFY